MLNLRPFQIFMLALFAVLAVVAIVLLSGFSPDGKEDENRYGDRVLIWGTLDQKTFDNAFMDIADDDDPFGVVEYRKIDQRTFNEVFVNAIAEGNPPDMVLLSGSLLAKNRSKLLAIPYETIPLRSFKDKYIDGGELFALNDGIYALPMMVDPMVMYWNRDMFASSNLAQAPTTWEEIIGKVASILTIRDNNRNIIRSAIAFGEVRNVRNAKEILLSLTLQSGSKMIYEDKNKYEVGINRSISGAGLPPLEAATQFFINFSNTNSQVYSWNRSQPMDRNAFLSGDLGMYFGFGSEAKIIQAQNPNLNFDIAFMPQGDSATTRRTYGEFYGLAIPKASKNSQGAFLVANVLTNPNIAKTISDEFGMAPAQRSAIAAGSGDQFGEVVYSSGLVSRGWLDPDNAETDVIFQEIIENIISGRETLSTAVRDGVQRITLAF